jgi:hypothetical protein
MNKAYLHIAYDPPVANWLPRMMTRLRESASIDLQSRMKKWSKTPLREMGLALSTKLAMLSLVVDRLDERIQRLYHHLALEEDKVQTCINDKGAYTVPESLLPYEILLDIDGFLFETRSVYEIVGKFIEKFHTNILCQRLTQEEIKNMMALKAIDTRWIEELRTNRNLFVHETAPWIALEVKSQNPAKFEILVMKRDIKDFSNSQDYISLDQLRDIFNGFNASMDAIYAWLIEKITDYEKATT